jgi:predicted ATPase
MALTDANLAAMPGAGKKGLVAEVVLTGGPAGGKTASLPFISASLASRGYRVLLVPEQATALYTGGVPDVARISQEERPLYVALQGIMFLEAQRSLREHYQRLAAFFQQPVIIIYDRGELDVRAYLTEEEFAGVLERSGYTVEELRDSYDAVIHLATAAGDLFSDLSGNRGRREDSTDEAVAADERTWEAWSGHPHHYRIDSNVSLDVKLVQALSVIAETIARKTADDRQPAAAL